MLLAYKRVNKKKESTNKFADSYKKLTESAYRKWFAQTLLTTLPTVSNFFPVTI
ncbi:MAG: hypothetical protein KAH48_01735 [Chlorobi bacterium]|nr:hypothetical protein [Chlorobiota bacterium]